MAPLDLSLFAWLLSFLSLAFAIDLDLDNDTSILNAAAIAASGMMALYSGDKTGGVVGKWVSLSFAPLAEQIDSNNVQSVQGD